MRKPPTSLDMRLGGFVLENRHQNGETNKDREDG